MKRTFALALLALTALLTVLINGVAQDRIVIDLMSKGGKGAIAIPDLRGTGAAQPLMSAFNTTLWNEIDGAGIFRMVPKTSYPLQVPQTANDWKPGNTPAGGLALRDWSGPPVNAAYMAFGYTAVQNNRLVLYGWFYNVAQNDAANAQVFGRVYNGTVDEPGARLVAQQFAADILKQFGAESLASTKIVFVSNRTGSKEIWRMDYDGSNQKAITNYNSISTMPTVSPDGTRVAFTSFVRGTPEILIHSLESGRRLPFYNQTASMNAQASFTPDGKTVLFSSTAGGGFAQIYAADANGAKIRRLTSTRAVEVEPKVNPKTGAEVVFVSGRSGPPQVYKMNIEGSDIVRLTTGEGEAVNPAWHPDGQHIAFAWTRGFEPGNYNIFVMDIASRQVVQLTHNSGRNENPTWAPDGKHIVYSSKRGGRTQIYSMLADGTQVKPLTTQGDNLMPVWTR